ncbi:MAG TPA: CHAT domain-containing tetratricopeptide repeat protein [Pyrinomonadaceae bacterium]|nr:CHAT domain-containing tetratricopeptide repeat protein [Pyrinomonadaceae bacterium]
MRFTARFVGALLSASFLLLPLATVSPQQTGNADTALKQGKQLLKRGHADQALGLLENALQLYTAAKNRRGIASAQNELGDLYLRQGQTKVALDHYRLAYEALSAAAAQEQTEASTASSAARMAGSSNAGVAAETAASMSDTGFNANLILAKIGDTNARLGRAAEAFAAYNQMRVKKPESVASRTTRRLGGLGGMLGSISTGKVDVAMPTSTVIGVLEAKKEFDLYRDSIVYSTFEIGMGRINYFNNDFEGAKNHFQNAYDATGASLANVAKLGQTRRFRAAARTGLADVALRMGKTRDAGKLYEDAAKGAKEDKRLDLMWPAQRGMGRSYWLQAAEEKDKKAMQLREKAIENYQNAIATIETLREGSIRADEARTTFLATTKDVFDEAATALATMALLTAPAPGTRLDGKALEYASAAFKVTEQTRARSLLDMLAETDSQITEGVPPDLLKRKQENLEKQQEIAGLLTGIVVAPDQQKKKPADLEEDLDKLQTEFDDIENQIRTASPRYAALTAGKPLTLAEVQQSVLDDNTALLEYSLGTEQSFLWVITKSGTSLLKLPPRGALDKLATDFRAQLIPSKLQRRIVGIDVVEDPQRGLGIASSANPADAAPLIAASNALYQAAVQPAAGLIGDKRLLVVADGALNYVPFEALVTSAATADFASAPYLVKTNEIIYTPSASVIGAIRQQTAKSAGRAMLIVADPVFNSVDDRARGVATANATDTRGLGLASAVADVAGLAGGAATATPNTQNMVGLPLARLNGTRAEADQISKLAKSSGGQADVWLDLNANEENVETRDTTKYRVIHIATHGLLDAERPQFTGLVLSLIGNKNQDGFLRTDEVFNLKLGAPLVMLSACETGLGKEKRGEGVMGLTRAFIYAGAPTVGVSLWSVADKSTAELMTEFYKRLFASESPSASTSMRAAQLAMISGKKYSAPFYWAPFILVGDWK